MITLIISIAFSSLHKLLSLETSKKFGANYYEDYGP